MARSEPDCSSFPREVTPIYLSGLLAVLVFCLMMFLRAGVGQDDPSQTLFGDHGDGLFNLWVLEHVAQHFPEHLLTISDGRIFYPSTDAYWFSDNLIALSPPYLATRALGYTRLQAGYFGSVFWQCVFFMVLWWFFREIHLTGNNGQTRRFGQWLCPWLALAVMWMPARVVGLQHFQNHAQCYFILLAIFSLRNLRNDSTASLLGMAASIFCLFVSAPYYAVLGFVLLLAWFLCLLADPCMNWKKMLFQGVPRVLPIAVACIPVMMAYSGAGRPAYHRDDLVRDAWRLTDLLPPQIGGRLAAYPGLWFTLLICGILLIMFWRLGKEFSAFSWRREGLLALLFLLTYLKVKELYPFMAILRVAVQVAAIALLVQAVRCQDTLTARVMLLFFLSGLFIIGIAMGPGDSFKSYELDATVWWIFKTLIPGVGSLRGLLRLMPMAALFFTALIYMLMLYAGDKVKAFWRNGIAFALIAVALLETGTQRAPGMRIDAQRLTLSEEEASFFKDFRGVVLEIPVRPFYLNTLPMLRWQSLSDIHLVNGYSGRSTDTMNELMATERQFGPGSPEQMAAVRRWGVDRVCLQRWRISDVERERLSRTYPVVFENERFLVLALKPQP